jgi:hypothetical protein
LGFRRLNPTLKSFIAQHLHPNELSAIRTAIIDDGAYTIRPYGWKLLMMELNLITINSPIVGARHVCALLVCIQSSAIACRLDKTKCDRRW